MKYTERLGLKKPDQTDFYNVEDSNFNMDKIDSEITILKDGIEETKEKVDNIELTGNKVTIADAENNFTSVNVEGALQELATIDKELTNKDKALDTKIDTTKSALETAIADNKTEIDGEIADLKQSVSSGKELIATAVTGKDVPTNGSDSFQKMADNIDSIIVRSPIADDEIGVVQWEDGSYKGFKEETYTREMLSTSDRNYKAIGILRKINRLTIDNDRNIYGAYNNQNISSSIVYKMDKKGTLIWEQIPGTVIQQPILDNQKNVIVSANVNGKGNLFKYSNSGDLKWTKELTTSGITAYDTDEELNVYAGYRNTVSGVDKLVVKLDSETGEITKTKDLSDQILAISYNEKLSKMFILGANGGCYILNKELELLSQGVLDQSFSWVQYHDNGNATISTYNRVFYIDQDFKTLWTSAFSASDNAIAINELYDHYICAGNAIIRLNAYGQDSQTVHGHGSIGYANSLGGNLIGHVHLDGDAVTFFSDNYAINKNIQLERIINQV